MNIKYLSFAVILITNAVFAMETDTKKRKREKDTTEVVTTLVIKDSMEGIEQAFENLELSKKSKKTTDDEDELIDDVKEILNHPNFNQFLKDLEKNKEFPTLNKLIKMIKEVQKKLKGQNKFRHDLNKETDKELIKASETCSAELSLNRNELIAEVKNLLQKEFTKEIPYYNEQKINALIEALKRQL